MPQAIGWASLANSCLPCSRSAAWALKPKPNKLLPKTRALRLKSCFIITFNEKKRDRALSVSNMNLPITMNQSGDNLDGQHVIVPAIVEVASIIFYALLGLGLSSSIGSTAGDDILAGL